MSFNSICDFTSFLEAHRVYVINIIIKFNNSLAAKRSRVLLLRNSLQLGRPMWLLLQRLLLAWSFPDLDLKPVLCYLHANLYGRYTGHMRSCVDFAKMLYIDSKILQSMECKSLGEISWSGFSQSNLLIMKEFTFRMYNVPKTTRQRPKPKRQPETDMYRTGALDLLKRWEFCRWTPEASLMSQLKMKCMRMRLRIWCSAAPMRKKDRAMKWKAFPNHY